MKYTITYEILLGWPGVTKIDGTGDGISVKEEPGCHFLVIAERYTYMQENRIF